MVSINTVFIILVIFFTFFFTLVLTWNYYAKNEKVRGEMACEAKLLNYCQRWLTEGEDPGDWYSISPVDCEKYGITRPTKEYCNEVLK